MSCFLELMKRRKKTRRTSFLRHRSPRHLPRRVRLLPFLPQQPSKVDVVLLSIASRQHKLSRKLPFSSKEGESDGVCRDRSSAETLHAVVVDEAVSAEGGDRVVDGGDRGSLDVAERRKRALAMGSEGALSTRGESEEERNAPESDDKLVAFELT